MTCQVCGKKAEFTTKGGLCLRHWAEWWVTGWYDVPNVDIEAEIQRVMDIQRKGYL